MLINFYCAIIKQNIDCNPLIGKQQLIRFYVGIFVTTSLIWLNILKYMKLKVANCHNLFHLIYIYIYYNFWETNAFVLILKIPQQELVTLKFLHSIPKWWDTLEKSWRRKCCIIFKVSHHFVTLCLKGLNLLTLKFLKFKANYWVRH